MKSDPSSKSDASCSTSLSLLERVRSHDQDAWERLVYVYGPLVYRWCRKYSIQAEDIGELHQEVFIAVWNQIDRFRRDKPGDSFRGWLWTITRNKMVDHIRRLNRQPQPIGGSAAKAITANIPAATPVEGMANTSSPPFANPTHRVAPLIRSDFEDQTWRAFWEVTIEGRQPADVAQDLGMKRDAVYQAKSRVLKRLRDELDGLLD